MTDLDQDLLLIVAVLGGAALLLLIATRLESWAQRDAVHPHRDRHRAPTASTRPDRGRHDP